MNPIIPQNIYLNCPFADKDNAKALGARWDKNTKRWYIIEGTPLEPFQKWLPTDITVTMLPQKKQVSSDGVQGCPILSHKSPHCHNGIKV